MSGVKANAQIRVVPILDLTPKSTRLKLMGQPYDELLMSSNSRHKLYKAKNDRITLKGGPSFQNWHKETVDVKYQNFSILKHFVNEVLRHLPGESGRHPGIGRSIIAYRRKFYFQKRHS